MAREEASTGVALPDDDARAVAACEHGKRGRTGLLKLWTHMYTNARVWLCLVCSMSESAAVLNVSSDTFHAKNVLMEQLFNAFSNRTYQTCSG